jgi:hypothetical protein
VPGHPRPTAGAITLGAVLAAVVCCALPLLAAAGLVTAAGLVRRNLLLVGLGVALATWLIFRAVRHAGRQTPAGQPTSLATPTEERP